MKISLCILLFTSITTFIATKTLNIPHESKIQDAVSLSIKKEIIQQRIDSISPEQTVLRYCELSRTEKTLEIKNLFAQIPVAYDNYRKSQWQAKNNLSKEVNPKTQNEDSVQRAEADQKFDLQISSESNYNDVVIHFPKYIKETGIDIKKIENSWVRDHQARVKVIFTSEKKLEFYPVWDFYLVKELNDEWKIFLIAPSDDSEMYPL